MRSRPYAAVLAAAAMFGAGPAAAQTGWGMMGQSQATPAASQARIAISSTDPIRELMFCVEDAAMRFNGLTVRFPDGTSQPIGLRDRLAAGRCGRAVVLRSRRAIAGVNVGYDPAVLAGATAKLQVYAR